jgi:hypothetical protein
MSENEQEGELFDEWFPLTDIPDEVVEFDEVRSAVASTIMKNMTIEEMTRFVYENILVDLQEVSDEELDMIHSVVVGV